MDTNNAPRFSFIIVNYRSAIHLPACFSSFQNITFPAPYECLVVNNDPEETVTLRTLQERFPFTLITLTENRGFGYAVNRAAERAQGTILILLNPDARFLSGDMSAVLKKFERDSTLGIAGFKLFIEPEMPQPWGVGTDITLLDLIRNHSGFPRSATLWKSEAPRRVAWVSGAALAIPRALFFRVHGFDERFFLYYEDADLCARVKKFRKKILLLPDICVLHMGGGSTDASRKEQKNAYRTSQDSYFSLHRPWYEGKLLKFLRGVARMGNGE